MGKFSNNLSKRRTLYDEMIRIYEENKDNAISVRKIQIEDQNFEAITNVSRSRLKLFDFS